MREHDILYLLFFPKTYCIQLLLMPLDLISCLLFKYQFFVTQTRPEIATTVLSTYCTNVNILL